MSIKSLTATITGIAPLLMNNPQTVDRFNPYARRMAQINAKKTKRTDDDYLELQDVEVRSKLYFDDAVGGVFVPSTWVTAAICGNSFRVAKTGKNDIRAGVYPIDGKLPLSYRDQHRVKTPDDLVGNPDFRIKLTLKQGQVRVVKAAPIFHQWSFSCGLEFDDKIIDAQTMEQIIRYSAQYGGFGDFRPTFGRAQAEVIHG